MKEFIEHLLDGFIKKSTVYTKLEEESESYNNECDKKQRKIESLKDELKQCINEKQECILAGQEVIEEKVKIIKKLENKLEEKEKARRKAVSSTGGLKKQIKNQAEVIEKLEKSVEFLKTNRRAPNIEELKDYFYRRKKK